MSTILMLTPIQKASNYNIKIYTQTNSCWQGDEVRVTGKKRDDLQAVMVSVRKADLGQPFQFKNFRD